MTSPENDFTDLVQETRASAGPLFVSARVEAEKEARELLNKHAGKMTPALASQLGKVLNRHYWGTGIRHNRFLPGLGEPQLVQMVADLDHFNQVVNEMWRGEESEALDTAGRIFTDSSYFPGAGRSFPSTLLYLRFSPQYWIWFSSLDRGLAAVSDYEGHKRDSGAEGYLDFCHSVEALISRYDLEPQEVDAVLAEASRRANAAKVASVQEAEIPTITRFAFEFLAGLRDSNTREWFDENRLTYEADIRDAMADVFEEVAELYIRGLDPKLNTQVQRDEVLARINKYGTAEPYYPYYWGAFSRGKKQEDVQLYINVESERLHYGLYLGSARKDVRERLADHAESVGLEFLQALDQNYPGLEWDQDDGDFMEIKTPADLAQWARGPDPHVRRILLPDHDLIGSPNLVDDIGRIMVALYPLAAIAWEEEPDLEGVSIPEEDLRPKYELEELVAETHLPAERLEEWKAHRRVIRSGSRGLMATFYPQQPAKNTPRSELDVWRGLDALPNSWRVFHSVGFQMPKGNRVFDGEADFVLLHPRHGFIVLEVKGGTVGVENGNWYQVSRGGARHSLSQSPFDQAKSAMYDLRTYLEPVVSTQLPCGRAVVLPAASHPGSMGPDAPAEQIISKDELHDMTTAIESLVLYSKLKADLKPEAVSAITQLLAPTRKLNVLLRTTIDESNRALIELTDRQIELLNFLRHQRRAPSPALLAPGRRSSPSSVPDSWRSGD